MTFKAYWDADLVSETNYIDEKTGVIRYTGGTQATLYVAATAQSGAQGVTEVRIRPEYRSFTATDVLFVQPWDSEYVRIYGYECITEEAYPQYGWNWNPEYNNFLIYQSDDPDQVYVDDTGYVYAETDVTGVYNVTVSSVNGVSQDVKVVVYREDEIEGVSIAPVKTNHPIYESIPLTAMVTLYGEQMEGNQFVTWSSDAPKVISVNAAGTARTLGIGTATITATTENGCSGSITLTVSQEPDNFTLPDQFEMTYGEEVTLGYESVEPEDAQMELTWTAEPAEVVTIEGDRLTANTNRDTTVTLTATNWDGAQRTTTLVIRMDASKLKTLRLPGGLTEIGEQAFMGGAFEAVIIPDECKLVGHQAFMNCTNLVYISYPAGTVFEDDAFEGCGEIKRVERN